LCCYDSWDNNQVCCCSPTESVMSCCRTTAMPSTPAWHSGKQWRRMGVGPGCAWMHVPPHVCRGSWPSRLQTQAAQQEASATQSNKRQGGQLLRCTQQCYCFVWTRINISIHPVDSCHGAFAAAGAAGRASSAPGPGSNTWLATVVVVSSSPGATYVHTSCCRAPPA
jgi:hypothetical protein